MLAVSAWVPSQSPFPLSVASVRLTANGKGGNEVKPGVVYRCHGILHTVEENPGKTQLRDNLMKTVRSVIASNMSLGFFFFFLFLCLYYSKVCINSMYFNFYIYDSLIF